MLRSPRRSGAQSSCKSPRQRSPPQSFGEALTRQEEPLKHFFLGFRAPRDPQSKASRHKLPCHTCSKKA